MPMIANKAFQLRANESYARGETIPPESWDGLRERTRRALIATRFVMPAPEVTTAPAPAPKSKRSV